MVLAFPLFTSHILELSMSLELCNLCYYQRYLYYIATAIAFIFFFIKNTAKIIVITMIIFFIASLGLSFYHVGIENGFFELPSECVSNFDSYKMSIEEILNKIKENVPCDEVNFTILMLSLAEWNFIYSFVCIVLLIILLNKINVSSKKEV